MILTTVPTVNLDISRPILLVMKSYLFLSNNYKVTFLSNNYGNCTFQTTMVYMGTRSFIIYLFNFVLFLVVLAPAIIFPGLALQPPMKRNVLVCFIPLKAYV